MAENNADIILEKFWGFDSFREPQKEIIDAAVKGLDSFALLPTGAGKSLCYQVSGLVRGGLTLVITPLVALMVDQVRSLNEKGILSVAIHSGLSRRDCDRLLDNCAYGDVKFLYVSPERLQTHLFLERFKRMPISLVAIDEAHCVSQWGYDFRPSYLEIKTFIEEHCSEKVPRIALTATATPEVVIDIKEKLGLRDSKSFSTQFFRSNLSFRVRFVDNKLLALTEVVKTREPSIIYAGTRREVKKISEYLNDHGISSTFYHAGLENKEKIARQGLWGSGEVPVIVATNAFGMGIDKGDVRKVVHMSLPKNIEAYYQESGRAGRDGQPSEAILFVQDKDLRELEESQREQFPERTQVLAVYEALCSHMNLAIGSMPEEVRPFNLVSFKNKYRMSVPLVLSSLKVLERNKVLSFNQSFFQPSTFIFLKDKKGFYPYQLSSQVVDRVVKALLRLYGGVLFSIDTKISEAEISNMSSVPRLEVMKVLKRMHEMELVNYAAAIDEPCVNFLMPRIQSKYLKLDYKIEGFLQERSEAGVKRMEEYVSLSRMCRSQFFAEYFGDSSTPKCLVCDNCSNGDGLNPELTRRNVMETIKDGGWYSIELLSETFGEDMSAVNELIRGLAAEGLIQLSHKGIKKA